MAAEPHADGSDAARPSIVSGVAVTALWTAHCRAEESKRDDPLVVDPLAERLCGPDGMVVGRAFEAEGRAHDAIVIRTRIVDERILAAAARGIRTFVSLGCGLCARPHRLALPAGTRFVEADLPDTIAWKEARLGRPAPIPVARMSIDLGRREDVTRVLQVVEGEPIVVVLEGVLQYLPMPAIEALFSSLAARGTSTFVICDVGGGAWSRLFARRIPAVVARRAAPYRTRIDDPGSFFAKLGFDVVADVSLAEWDARQPHRRWRTPWTARLVPGFRDAARVIDLASR